MTDETIFFFHLKAPYGCLSNASRHPIYLDGTCWKTVEHYFQTAKLKDPGLRDEIQRAETPKQARRSGRKHRQDQRGDWHDIKVGVMRKALVAKAIQHADVRATLLVTAPSTLVQRSDAGDYWGGKKNMLGKLWMQVRERLAESGEFDALSRPPAPPWEAYPDLDYKATGSRMDQAKAQINAWRAFYNGLSPAGRARYRRMFPAPKRWNGFYLE